MALLFLKKKNFLKSAEMAFPEPRAVRDGRGRRPARRRCPQGGGRLPRMAVQAAMPKIGEGARFPISIRRRSLPLYFMADLRGFREVGLENALADFIRVTVPRSNSRLIVLLWQPFSGNDLERFTGSSFLGLADRTRSVPNGARQGPRHHPRRSFEKREPQPPG